jgi:hypothetical protein
MEYLCRLPSLVVYNGENSPLKTLKDLSYKRRGKEGRSDTIGEFGLGVLTMYHFTDVCVISSSLT